MNITSTEMVQIRFKVIEDDGSEFVDGLYISPEQRATMTAADIQALQEERYNNWQAQLAAAANAVAPVDESEELVLADIAALEEARAAIDDQLAQRNATLAVLTAQTSPAS